MHQELYEQGRQLIGVTENDVREVLQAAVYCGIPAALGSFRAAEAVFTESLAGR